MTKKSTHSSAAELSFKFPIIYKHIHICICTHIYMYVHTFTCACIIYHNKSIHAIISCRVIIGIPIKFAVESIVGVWSGVCCVCVGEGVQKSAVRPTHQPDLSPGFPDSPQFYIICVSNHQTDTMDGISAFLHCVC